MSGQDVKGASPPGALKGVSAQDVKRSSLGSFSCIPHGGGDGRGGGSEGGVRVGTGVGTLNAIFSKAFHEGGVVGAVEGLALSSGAFPLWNALDDKLKHAKTNA